MGCAASAPQVAEGAPRKHHPGEGDPVDAPEEAPTPAVEIFRGGGKGVDRAVAESSRKALRQILSGRFRDWLLDSAGKRVKIDALKGAPVGILFTAQTIPQGRRFQKLLLEMSEELRNNGRPFEVVLVSNDETEELWKSAIADTPFLTIPFKDHATIDSIGTRFEIEELPTFIIIDREGNFVTKDGLGIITKLGASAWPFNAERMKAASAPANDHDRGL